MRRGRASISVLGSAALAAAAGCGGGEPARTSALLVTLDTTRADALSCFGARPGLTPALDRLAAEGVRYERAYTVAPLTLPAHASMLTGLWPARHGVRLNGAGALPDEAVSVAERAREQGWQTAAFVAAAVLERSFGLDQGFEVYDQVEIPEVERGMHYAERPAGEVVAAARAWLAGRDRARPFFLWVHLFDAHAPYEAAPEHLARAGGDAYRAQVAAADDAIGALLGDLRADGSLDHVLVIAVADHGEALGDHGEPTHGAFCYESVLRVPLIVRRPDRARAGERERGLASVADVAPTLLEAFGLAPLADSDGSTLLSRPPSAERALYFECLAGAADYGWSPLIGRLDARGKYLHSSRPELYDLAGDPTEARDLSLERPDEAERQRAALAALLARPGLRASAPRQPNERLLQEIAKLGYAGGSGGEAQLPDPMAPSDRPSPRDRIAENQRFLEAQGRLHDGRAAEALPLLEAIAAENPEHREVALGLAAALMKLSRYADAIPHLERLTAARPDWYGAHGNLALCYERVGRIDDAIRQHELALEAEPDLALAARELVRLLESQGRSEEAARYRERLAGGGV